MSLLASARSRLRRKRPPRCFMHVPKCAGISVLLSLEDAFPDAALAPYQYDVSTFCGFSEFDRLDEPLRSQVAVDDSKIAELGDYEVVAGHFSLPSLLSVAPASNIATVLREPRARLVSAFMFLRLSGVIEFLGPYGKEVLAGPARSLETVLADPFIAQSFDNQICRMVLRGDSRVRDCEFVAPGDVEGLAEATIEQLDRLGAVEILEFDDIWSDLSEFFGVSLEHRYENASGAGETPEGALPITPYDMSTVLELIDQRSSADRLVYGALLERRLGDGDRARRMADAAFASELVRFGDLTGAAATKLAQLDRQDSASTV
jgi:hypothetical protein